MDTTDETKWIMKDMLVDAIDVVLYLNNGENKKKIVIFVTKVFLQREICCSMSFKPTQKLINVYHK